jgi:hypothetical protein
LATCTCGWQDDEICRSVDAAKERYAAHLRRAPLDELASLTARYREAVAAIAPARETFGRRIAEAYAAGYGAIEIAAALGTHRSVIERNALTGVRPLRTHGSLIRPVYEEVDGKRVRLWQSACKCGWRSDACPTPEEAAAAYDSHRGVALRAVVAACEELRRREAEAKQRAADRDKRCVELYAAAFSRREIARAAGLFERRLQDILAAQFPAAQPPRKPARRRRRTTKRAARSAASRRRAA